MNPVRGATLLVSLAVLCATVTARSYFFQNECSDPGCSQNCEESQLPQDECVLTDGGTSAVCYCTTEHLIQQIYYFTQNCTLAHYKQEVDLNTCVGGETDYVQYACPGDRSSQPEKTSKTMKRSRWPTVVPYDALVATDLLSSLIRGPPMLLGVDAMNRGDVSVRIAAGTMSIHVHGARMLPTVSMTDAIAIIHAGAASGIVHAASFVAKLQASHTASGLVIVVPLDEWDTLKRTTGEASGRLSIVHGTNEMLTLAW